LQAARRDVARKAIHSEDEQSLVGSMGQINPAREKTTQRVSES
jgi:hypothetical protein